MPVSQFQASQRCSKQAALEGQDLPCMYLAHHELESIDIIMIIVLPVSSNAVKLGGCHFRAHRTNTPIVRCKHQS